MIRKTKLNRKYKKLKKTKKNYKYQKGGAGVIRRLPGIKAIFRAAQAKKAFAKLERVKEKRAAEAAEVAKTEEARRKVNAITAKVVLALKQSKQVPLPSPLQVVARKENPYMFMGNVLANPPESPYEKLEGVNYPGKNLNNFSRVMASQGSKVFNPKKLFTVKGANNPGIKVGGTRKKTKKSRKKLKP